MVALATISRPRQLAMIHLLHCLENRKSHLSLDNIHLETNSLANHEALSFNSNHLNAEGQIKLGKITVSAVEEVYKAKE